MAAALAEHRAPLEFIETEVAEMKDWRVAKTANRSVVGVMNEFVYLGEACRPALDEPSFHRLSLRLANVPCGPLYSRHGSPDRELAAFLAERLG